MISAVLGLSVLVDCIVIFHVCNFWKSPFYCRYNAGFFCELTRIFLLGQTLRWLLWTVSTTLSRPIIGGIYTPVPVLCTPGWSDYSMPTSRWFRMMTVGWCFNPL
jgi:hypothetical protein